MRSDREEIPEGFTKADADKAETMEARQTMSRMASPGCQVYWPSPYQVCGAIKDKYNSLGGPNSFLLWPTTNELVNPDGHGRRSLFQNGPIYWSAAGGAHPVVNHFHQKWGQYGYESGFLGYPTTDEVVLNGGRLQDFQGATIYWSPLTGAHPVGGAVRDRWAQTGWEGGTLGYPTSDEIVVGHNGEGRMNRFEHGVIYWSPSTGAHSIRGDILEQWSLAGYEKSSYGYPTSEPVDDGTGWFTQQFSNGSAAGEISSPVSLTPSRYIEFATREEALAYFDSLENGQTAPGALTQPESRGPRGTVTYGPCTLTPNYIHWRSKSGPGKGNGVVGFKPKTTCTVPVTSISHETDLKYEYYTFWRTAISVPATAPGSSPQKLEQKNLAFACTGEVETWFGGRTLGIISYGGKTYYAAVYPPKMRFNCEV